MVNTFKQFLLITIGILAVVLFLQTSNLITGLAAGEAEDVTTQFGSVNAAPWADNFTVLSTAPFGAMQPCAESTTNMTFRATLHDMNGYQNITGFSGKLWNPNTTTANCASNLENCYYNFSTCAVLASSGTYKHVQCNTSKLKWYADNSTTWGINFTVTDGIATTSNSSFTSTVLGTYPTFTVPLQKALNANDSIDFGPLSPGATSSAITNNVTNCGNFKMDIDLNATAMTCSGLGSAQVPAANIGASNVSGSWKLSMTGTFATLKVGTNAGTDATPMPFNVTYWNVTVPTGVSGNCIGNVTFKAVVGS